MNIIADLIAWTMANWDDIIKVYLQVIGLASVVVKLTPNLKDDDVLKNVLRFLGKYVALNRSADKPV